MADSDHVIHVVARRSGDERAANVRPVETDEAAASAGVDVGSSVELHRQQMPDAGAIHHGNVTSLIATMTRGSVPAPDIRVTARRGEPPQPQDVVRKKP